MKGYKVWKVFTYKGKEIFSYTMPEEVEEEEELTLRVLAAEYHCRIESIHIHNEMRRNKKCQV